MIRRPAAGGSHANFLRAVPGFTLIEMLVVLAILGIVGLAVGLSVNSTSAGASRQEAQRLAMTLETLWLEARVSGRRLLWRSEKNAYRWWEKNPRLETPDRFSSEISGYRIMGVEGMHIAGVVIDGRHVDPTEAIELGPLTPMFQVDLRAGADHFLVRSLPTGKLVVTEPAAKAE